MKKRVLSAILAITLLSSTMVAFADEINVEEAQTVEQNKTINTLDVIEDSETENIYDIDNATDSQLDDTSFVAEYAGEYKQSDVYSVNTTDSQATQDDIVSATSIDRPEYIDDSESMIYTQELTSSIAGWARCASMFEEKSYMSSVALDDRIYTFGGTKSGEIVKTTEVYDTVSEVWTRKTPMTEGRYKHTAVYVNGNIYICGGYNANGEAVSGIAMYNPEYDTWADNDISTPNNNTNYAAAVYNNELYIFGGKENGVNTKKSYKYNFATNKWTSVMSMPISSIDAKAVPTSFGFYILYESKVAKYEISKKSFEWVDNVQQAVTDYAVIAKDYTSNYASTPSQADCLVISGGKESDDSAPLASVRVRSNTDYTFKTPWMPEWYNDLRLINGLAAHNMVEVNGYIYVFGGQTAAGTEERAMFRRKANEWHDDYPDQKTYSLVNNSVYGSINHKNDVDNFIFTPSQNGKYEIQTLDAIYTNNIGYKYNVQIIEEASGKEITNNDFPIMFGGIPMEAGKSYRIIVTDAFNTYTGNYYFKVNKVTDDAPDTIAEAIEMPLETTISKTFLGKLDIDCLYFDIPITGMYDIEVLANGNTIATIKLNDNDTSKTQLYSYKSNTTSVKNIRLNKGRYYISLSAPNTDYDYTNPQYTVKVSNTEVYQQMYNARYRHGLVAVDDMLYAIGGLNDEYDTELMIEAYNPDTEMWKRVTESENVFRQGTSAISVGEKIYLVGGIDDYSRSAMKYYPLDDNIMIYDTKTDEWEGTEDIEIYRERVGLAENEGNIYIVGGRSYDPTEYSTQIQVFDIETYEVIDYPISLPTGIVDPQVFFANDIMYVVGGVDKEGYSSKIYALENNAWTEKTSMPYASSYMRGKAWDDDFYCAAVNSAGNVDILKYDTTDDEWRYLYSRQESFIKDLSYYGVDILDGMMYISGGYSEVSDKIRNNIYAYDIVTDVALIDTAIPVRTMGYEYEQTVNDDTTGAPKIIGVNAKVLDNERGVYELFLTEDDYECDTRNKPFFFWSAREGMFTALSDNYTRVKFNADAGTGDRQVKVVVGIGDRRGYVDKKAFLLPGNSDTE